MRRLTILFALLLVGCGGPSLAGAVLQPGDFPEPYRTKAGALPWRIYPGIPTTGTFAYYEIIEGSDSSNEVGHIAVVKYTDAALADKAYAAMRSEAELNKAIQPVAFGETGSQSGPASDWNASDVLFRRCNTIVHVSLQGNTVAQLVAYAQKLDTRMQPVVCT